MKHCFSCHRNLDETRFAPDSRYADGRSPRCLDCTSGQRPQPAPQPCLSDVLPGRAPPENPWIEAKRRAWAQRDHREPARRARKAVAKALERGKLTRKRCEYGFDGCVGWPVQFHHLSYERGRELDGKWACQLCHDRLTAPAREQENASRARS